MTRRKLPDLETTLQLCRDYAIHDWETYKANVQRLGLPGNPRERFKGAWPGLNALKPTYLPTEIPAVLERLGVTTYAQWMQIAATSDPGLIGLYNPRRRYGLSWGEITGRVGKAGRPTRCVTTGEVFPSTRAAAKAFGLDTSSVRKAANRGNVSRFTGLQFEYAESQN